jgi:hypothetical protein
LINPYHIKDTKEHFEMILKTIKENESVVKVSKEVDLIEKFGKEFKKNKKKFTKNKIANMFFVYDFFMTFKKNSINNIENINLEYLLEERERMKSEPNDLYKKERLKNIEDDIKKEKSDYKNNPTMRISENLVT